MEKKLLEMLSALDDERLSRASAYIDMLLQLQERSGQTTEKKDS